MHRFIQLIRESVVEAAESSSVGISPDEFKRHLASGHTPNTDHLHTEAQSRLSGDFSHIGPDEKHAVGRWTDPDGYKKINGHMRGTDPSGSGKTMAEHLGNAVNGHSLPNSAWAYRGIHAVQSDNLRQLKSGDTFHAKGFSSTTLDPYRASHFARGEDMLAVHVPKGSHALYVSHPKLNNWTSERELLLPNNTHFQYHGSEDVHVPEHDYSGRPTGKTKPVKLHHVSMVDHSDKSFQIDR